MGHSYFINRRLLCFLSKLLNCNRLLTFANCSVTVWDWPVGETSSALTAPRHATPRRNAPRYTRLHRTALFECLNLANKSLK